MKSLTAFAISLLSALTLYCQNPCEAAYQLAREDFSKGRLEEVINHLQCVYAIDVSRPLRRNMLALMVEAYIFQDDLELAELTYAELLKLDPFFRLNDSIPELKNLGRSFSTYPVTTYSLSTGLFFRSIPVVQQSFSPQDVTIRKVSYNRQLDDLFGWTAGINAQFNFYNTNFDFGIGYGLSNIFFRYTAELENALADSGERGDATLSFLEKQRWNQFPVTLSYNFVPKSKIIHTRFIPYVYAGIAWEVLIRKSAEANGPNLQFSNLNERASTDMISLREHRNRFNFSFLGGAGVRLHIKRFFFSLEGKYHYLLKNIAKEKTRFSNDQLNREYNYADDDFTLQSFGLAIGGGVYLFNSPKR